MMNLIARTPSHVSSSTSVSPGKRSYGSQDPWSSVAKKEERSGRLISAQTNSKLPITITIRATTPLFRDRLKNKGHGKLSIHSAADLDTIKTFEQLFL